MGQALYRKYRSKSFSEVVGQEPITETLEKAIKTGRISHAYLLAGPRGVGKTSVARILAHEVNKLPYTSESVHLDIIEIDAASNRRIDEIRGIREKVHISPTSAKYKVYIIDEVHMLTKEAFNALLKTLEEPPAHCIFILATTEPHKLPETIISRTQRFNFRPVPTDQTASHLERIAKQEKIGIEPAALAFLAEHSQGSLRDAISMLDQLSSAHQPITEEDSRQLLGLPPRDSISRLLELVYRGDTSDLLKLLGELRQAGNGPALIAAALGRKIRGQLITTRGDKNKQSTRLLKNLLEVGPAHQPFDILEITMLEAALANDPSAAISMARPNATVAKPRLQPQARPNPSHSIEPEQPPKISRASNFEISLWPEVLSEVKKRAASIYTALRLAEPEVKDNILTLIFQFPLHKKKLEQAQHIKLISDVIDELSGAQIEIKCATAEKELYKPASDSMLKDQISTAPPAELANISNIFGSAEMLES